MLILAHGAIRRLVETGNVDVWSPAAKMFQGELVEAPEPALNVQHVVRRRFYGQTITHARARGEWVTVGALAPGPGRDEQRTYWRAEPVRAAVLQDLTVLQAAAAGFRTRDDFYAWWRTRYLVRPHTDCYVVTYEAVAYDAAYYLSGVIDPGKQGDYTGEASRAIDELEAPDAEEWARKAEADRKLHRDQARMLWRARRRKRAA